MATKNRSLLLWKLYIYHYLLKNERYPFPMIFFNNDIYVITQNFFFFESVSGYHNKLWNKDTFLTVYRDNKVGLR